jgi:hypothetical protein
MANLGESLVLLALSQLWSMYTIRTGNIVYKQFVNDKIGTGNIFRSKYILILARLHH